MATSSGMFLQLQARLNCMYARTTGAIGRSEPPVVGSLDEEKTALLGSNRHGSDSSSAEILRRGNFVSEQNLSKA